MSRAKAFLRGVSRVLVLDPRQQREISAEATQPWWGYAVKPEPGQEAPTPDVLLDQQCKQGLWGHEWIHGLRKPKPEPVPDPEPQSAPVPEPIPAIRVEVELTECHMSVQGHRCARGSSEHRLHKCQCGKRTWMG